jgi:thiamine biosynthesis lipoprotein
VMAMAITEMLIPNLRHSGLAAGATDRTQPDGPGTGWTAAWSSWGTSASVTVTDPAALPAARRIVSRQFAAAEKAAARSRKDAELHKLYRAGGRGITISSQLAELVSAALVVAERTNGDVDPTVGAAMNAVHSGRRPCAQDRSGVPTCGSRATSSHPAVGWEQVRLLGRRLRVPAGTTLDLSATAKAFACDRAAARVRERLDVGVLVRLGSDAASAGPAPERGWIVPISDRLGRRSVDVLLPPGSGLATSHFTARNAEPGISGHYIDPHTGEAPPPIWRMASAIGFSSLEAATYTTASLVRGTAARGWLTQLWVPARLITVYDDVVTSGSWDTHVVPSELAPPEPLRTMP